MSTYKLSKELGRGAFGVTYLGEDAQKRKYAVKAINIRKSEELNVNTKTIEEEINTLAELSRGVCSPYIACYKDSSNVNLNGEPTILIVSEFIDGFSLTKIIESNSGTLAKNGVWPLMMQLLLGLRYIHSKDYAHRDIKPDNIMVTKDLHIKYIDFGLACLDKCHTDYCTNTCRGTPGTLYYMPPEYFTGKQQNSLVGSKAHDVWSLAVVICELLYGLYAYPYPVADEKGYFAEDVVYNNIASAPSIYRVYEYDDGRSDKFVQSLLINEWTSRPTIDEALELYITTIPSVVWS